MIIAIVGKTASGKDTIAHHLSEKYHVPIVCSATTRPMRVYEENGKQHWFVSKEKMKELKESPHVIAYTKMPVTGIEYAATTDMVPGKDMIYVINPDGIDWFRKHGTKEMELKSIYVYLPERKIIQRALTRSDRASDVFARLASENEDMDRFLDTHGYDYKVNNDRPLEETLKDVDHCFEEMMKEREYGEPELC